MLRVESPFLRDEILSLTQPTSRTSTRLLARTVSGKYFKVPKRESERSLSRYRGIHRQDTTLQTHPERSIVPTTATTIYTRAWI